MTISESIDFKSIQTLYGGYHRYDFVDHAYLYNLYFPVPQIFNYLKNHISQLVANYPVGHTELTRLLANWTAKWCGGTDKDYQRFDCRKIDHPGAEL